MAGVSIPMLFKDLTGGERRAEVRGTTLGEVVRALEALYPGIEARIRDGDKLSPTVALVVDGRIASAGLSTPVDSDSQVNILPSLGGG